MKNRILKGWTLIRALYLLSGIAVIFQSYQTHAWIGILFGGYITSMGVFGFGCAAGNCTPRIQEPSKTKNEKMNEIVFEEVKE